MFNVDVLWEKGKQGRGIGADFSCTRNIFASAIDNDINIWRLSDGELLRKLQGNGYVKDLIFSPDGSQLLSSHYHTTFIWNTNTFQRTHEIGVANASLAYHPKGTYFATTGGYYSYNVGLWMPDMGEKIRELCGHTAIIDLVRFNHDGTILVSGDRDGNVKLWIPETGELIFETQYQSSISSFAFAADNNLLAIGAEDGAIQIINTDDGTRQFMFPLHEERIICTHWLQGGTQIASTSVDGTVLVWNVQDGELQKRITINRGRISFFRWGCDQKYFAVSNDVLRIFTYNSTSTPNSVHIPSHTRQHHNIDILTSRMGDALNRKDYAEVLHASASIFETLAKDVVGTLNVENQTLKSFFELYRKDSLLPQHIQDYILNVYNERNQTPLAGHGSLREPVISEQEAIILRNLTIAIVNSEYELMASKNT